MKSANPRRIVLVNSIVERNDAISSSVRDMARGMSEAGHDVTVLCHSCHYDELSARLVGGITDLLLDDAYRAADLIVWHFGIWYELFNAILVGNGHARQVVCFHNVTPKAFVPEANWPNIERSLRQAHLLTSADEIWPVSDLNAQTARDVGVRDQSIHTIPLQVDQPSLHSLDDKPRDRIELLYVGRFVKAKGVDELLRVVASLRQKGGPPFFLTLAGNISFSDAVFYDDLQEFVSQEGLGDIVTFAGTVDDDALQALYHRSHVLAIPSYHEGFCKPVIEGLRAGCIPVGYASYNLPAVANGLGRLVPPGDITALTTAFGEVISAVHSAMASPGTNLLPLDAGALSIAEFTIRSTEFVQQFTGQGVAARIGRRVDCLLAESQQGEGG